MAKSKGQFGHADRQKGEPLLISDDLRDWIDRVIVPILVQEFIGAKSLQKEANDG
jgi:hypothetical protein